MEEHNTAGQENANLSEKVIDTDIQCIQCEYKLIGLQESGVCPECGTPVAESSRGILLAYSESAYLRRLVKGLNFVLLAILIYFLTSFLVPGLTGFGLIDPVIGDFSIGGAFLGSILSVIGWVFVTTVDSRFEGKQKGDGARLLVRGTAIALFVLSLAMSAIGIAIVLDPIGLEGLVLLFLPLMVINFVVFVVHVVASVMYIRWLARRVPDKRLAGRAKTFYWLGPVLMTVGLALLFVGPLIAVLLYINMLTWLRKDVKRVLAGQAS